MDENKSNFVQNCNGKCPHCKSENIWYGVMKLEYDNLYYIVYCKDCLKTGREWYSVTYTETEKR